jgi:predicted dehydrogenase
MNNLYKRGRRLASKVKHRVMPQQAQKTFTVPSSKPAITPEALAKHGTFRAAVIGAGNQGRDICVGLKGIEGVEIAAIADRSAEALARVQAELALPHLKTYEDTKALLDAEKPDLVCVATNTPSHVPLAMMALEAGAKYLLVEKPIGTNLQGARQLVDCAAEKGVLLAIDHGRRWSLDYQAMQRYIAGGIIGKVREIYVAFGSGGLAMNGVHYIDLVRYFIDSPISWVIGQLDAEAEPNKRGAEYHDPSGYMFMSFADGARAFLDLSADLVRKDSFLVIKTEHGRIEVDERAREWTVVSQTSTFTVPFSDSKTLSGKVARVAAELLSGIPPRSNGEDGIRALEAVLAAHLSHENGHQPVHLPLSAEQQAFEVRFP